jgi:hypothetical protein
VVEPLRPRSGGSVCGAIRKEKGPGSDAGALFFSSALVERGGEAEIRSRLSVSVANAPGEREKPGAPNDLRLEQARLERARAAEAPTDKREAPDTG